jgi:phenylalanyl-tRNA synthetase beta chain
MKLPLSVLKSFIDIDASIAKIEDTLTTLGIEVDKVHGALPPFEGVVVAEVKSCRRHESSDKLQVAEVFDGKDLHQVVCGASNCRVGLKTAFAKVGAKIRDAGEKFYTIEPSKIRGIESHGMLCSASELGIYEDNAGIIELPAETALGADCLKLLWDPVLEISLTPNLGHCMSALGIARELSAAWKKPLHAAKHSSAKHKNLPNVQAQVSNPTLCPRYMAQLIENVKVGPSPFWLQCTLQAAGHRPVNNVVDATNYILLKYGQPLHAFDYDKIEGHKVHIGPCHKEESFDALIGKTVILPPGTLVISDANKTIAIAGVMGGANSSVSESTSTILLEAASFDPIAVRLAAKKTDLRSEGSQRFEKGVDSSTVGDILEIATQLIVEIAGGTVSTAPIDLKTNIAPKQIRCRPARVNHVLGTKISHNEMKDIFHRLHILLVQETEQELLLQVPSYRLDLTEEIDLVEEIGRIYGYNHIERPLPKSSSPQLPNDPVYLFENDLRKRLIALGLQEFLTCDLISPKLAAINQEMGQFLRTLHAKSEDYSILRASLLPGILQVVKLNLDHKNSTIAAFEMGRIHLLQKGLPIEFPMAAIVLTGKEAPNHWDQKPTDADFFALKGLVENLLEGLRVKAHFVPSSHPTFHPGRQADLFFDSLHIGTLGELHPNTLALLDIKQRVYYAELNAQHLKTIQSPSPKFAAMAQFPSSERDWTLPIHPQTHISTIFDAIRSVHSPLLERFELIGTYRAEDKANVTIRFTYRDRTKTVSYDETQSAHDHLQQEVLAKTNMAG